MKNGPDNDSNGLANKTPAAHRIRLRGPCKLLWLRNGTQQAEVRVHIPCEITSDLFQLSDDSADDVFVLRRNFGMPTGLDESQVVTLKLDGFENTTKLVLNGGTDGEVEHGFETGSLSLDVTKQLRAQNRLDFEFECLPGVADQIQLIIEQRN